MKREMTRRSWKMTRLNLKLQKTEHSAEQKLTVVPFQASGAYIALYLGDIFTFFLYRIASL